MAQILLVEDDIQSRELLEEILETEGFQVCACGEYAAASEHIQQCEYDIILTDLALPDGSGLEVLALTKTQWPLSEVIIMTGYASLESAIKATDDGAAAYPSPFRYPIYWVV